ncbi:low molecular weight phosphotyrosine protein phosphatase [Marinobacter sediminum]|uniref:low molecular weight protein-tyrosine-phosphatase n=1 Tax=Marinobacter sediminum TaxID=256323 RepID=UPI00202F56A5|nr:low molecular weight protein-tyrosine-phosphatase [Marinobacter sediminum]MCM0612647.1 low molecular weight phosphotyrosine protein phosphatase [Marinobacter sediminum]
MFNNILIVCIGNICRSPMAEYLLRARLPENGGKEVYSAGIGALVDEAADDTALELLKEQGIDAIAHRAQQVTQEMLVDADLILVMEESHLKRLHEIAPQIRGRAFLLGKWQNDQPVPDPYRQQRPAFEHAFKLIDQAIESWLKHLGN